MIGPNVGLGLICRHARASGFKLAVVVGYPSTRWSTTLRVCVWRAATRRWTLPSLVEISELRMLDEADYKKHGSTIRTASQAALNAKLVERVWS